jgi:protein phosphatase
MRLSGMGTTVVIGQIADDRFYVAHVGDSRCYRVRKGEIKQITRDHSLLEDYKEARPGMSDEEQRKFPHKNVITRALGMRDTVQVDIASEEIQDGDIFLLCSDGLSGMVSDAALPEYLKLDADLDDAVNKLVGAANAAGGTDNITVLALECRLS